MISRNFPFLSALLLLTVFWACDREPLPPPEPVVNRLSVADLRKMYEKGISIIDSNVYIRGIITLTPELGNVPAFIAYLQDSTAGICLSVSGENSFAMDSEVKILCRGASFTLFNGLLQFGDISIADQAEVIRLNATPPPPAEITIDELLQGKREAEYVQIKNAQFADPGTFSGSRILTDCKSQIDVYTRSDATFAGTSLPTGNGTFRGIASVYTNRQLLLRDAAGLDMKGTRCGASSSVYLSQDFNTLVKYADVSTLTGWKTYAEKGGKSWYGNEVSSRKWVQATAYSSGQAEVITWMVSPVLDLTMAQKPFVSFESADGYDNGATLELYVSTGYAGSATPWSSTWTRLTFTLPASNTSGYSQFVSSGQVDLSAYRGGPVYLAWVYKGADLSGTASDRTTTWEIDNVVVADK
ncbi:MAG TPA: DUF5689 domain-containing protein [Prolixibacteraceae bacterium]|nr:DUF5689 domain-containing protein [Prolixibacteraceae bacterium]